MQEQLTCLRKEQAAKQADKKKRNVKRTVLNTEKVTSSGTPDGTHNQPEFVNFDDQKPPRKSSREATAAGNEMVSLAP